MGYFGQDTISAQIEKRRQEIYIEDQLYKQKKEIENSIRLAANWTGLYIYPGLRGEKKESL